MIIHRDFRFPQEIRSLTCYKVTVSAQDSSHKNPGGQFRKAVLAILFFQLNEEATVVSLTALLKQLDFKVFAGTEDIHMCWYCKLSH